MSVIPLKKTPELLADPPRLRDKLLARSYITPDQLAVALIHQHTHHKLLGEVLVDLGFIDDWALQQLLAEHTGYPAVNLDHVALETAVVTSLPRDLALQLRAVPFARQGKTLHIAMADPEDILAKDALRSYWENKVHLHPFHASPQQIYHVISRFYQDGAAFPTREGEVIQRVEELLLKAVQQAASDIHFQPEEDVVHVKFRRDGLLQRIQSFHKSLWPALCVRLKILSSLDIAESRRPQSGHFVLQLYGRTVNFRVSTHPTLHGENIVVRVLDASQVQMDLKKLGFHPAHLATLKKLVHTPQGLIVISGPTGSGKTTTLYALLAQMDANTRHIATLEQPIEYQLPGIRQTEIRNNEILSFATGIRSLLRQDPDVLMIGEIRDEETAQMALRAAMTGHLVLTTVHSATAQGVITRLKDLGISPATLETYLLCALAQRLVRKICHTCQGRRCEQCHHTGYKGRSVIAELSLRGELPEISLRQDAQRCVETGITTSSELARVLGTP